MHSDLCSTYKAVSLSSERLNTHEYMVRLRVQRTASVEVVALSGFMSDFAQLAFCLTDALLDALIVVEGHVPADLGLALRGGLPGLLRRVNEVHHLDVTEALNGLGRVHADLATTIVLNWHLIPGNHLHLHENERNCATLILERYIHVLRPKALLDRFFNLHVTLDKPL